MGKQSHNTIELTSEEIRHLYVMMTLSGFREKRDFPLSIRGSRTDMQRVMGKIMKKLRKADHFTNGLVL
jgi:hypothetical protein